MLRLYQVLTVLTNIVLAFGILSSVYEFIVGGYSNSGLALLFSAFCLYVIISTLYFIWNSRKFKLKNTTNTIDDEMMINPLIIPFRFSTIIGVSNILLGSLIISVAIYVLIMEPIFSFDDSEELLRFSFLIFALFYGVLKIYYSLRTVKYLKLNSSTPK